MNIKDIYHFLKDMQDDIDCDDVRISISKNVLHIAAYRQIGAEFCAYRRTYHGDIIDGMRHSEILSELKEMFIEKAKESFDGVENEKNKNKNPDDN